ncbi:hypothetical protein [Sphingobacterium faecium]|uniref:hypothetical protein n=1 Tax=Sphingobacterium faecium TaxID=34087 RepID=UPI00320A893F
MSNLELNTIDLQELNLNEMTNIDAGGFGPLGFGWRIQTIFSYLSYNDGPNLSA